MARNIIIVNAIQVVTSESHPEGIFSVMPGFPKVYDSGPNGDTKQNMMNAKSAYFEQLAANYGNTNPNRVMTTVTLEMVSGQQILKETIGSLPVTEEEPTE